MAVRFSAETQGYSTAVSVPNGAFTVTWWFFIAVDRNAYSTVWEPSASAAAYTQIGTEASGTQFGMFAGTGGDSIGAVHTAAVGTWYCAAYTQAAAGGAATLRVGTNPNNLTTYPSGVAPTVAATTLRIGASVFAGEWWNGRVASWKQWSAVLTEAEIVTELSQKVHVRTANFVRRFDFDAPQTTPSAGTGNLTGGTGATTEAGPALLESATPKSGAETVDELEAADLTSTGTGVDTATATDTAVVSVPVTGAETVSTTEAGSVFKSVQVTIRGAEATASGGALPISKNKILGGAQGLASGGDPDVAHHVTVHGAAALASGATAFAGATQPGGAEAIASGGAVKVGKAGDAAGLYGIPARVKGQRYRLMAQKILSGQWVSRELPISDLEIGWALGGATQITGVFRPEIKALRDIGLEPWGTWIHFEEEGAVRASGILTAVDVGHDGRLPLDAIGPMGYSDRIPFRGMYSGVQVDPADIVRMIWAHIQSFPRGQLGVTVTGSTPRTIGTEAREREFVTGDGEVVEFIAGPYQLNYWNNTMCGAEVQKLSTETPFDIIERTGWTGPERQDVFHRLELAYPQRGTRRNDLRFAQGENIISVGDITEPDDAYADTVYVQGKGEGIDAVRGEATVFVGERLRLPVVIADKTVDNTGRADAIAKEELAARLASLIELPEIEINTGHRNAPLGSFDVGDEILPRVRGAYGVVVRQWHRVTSIRYRPATQRAAVALTRRGEFRG